MRKARLIDFFLGDGHFFLVIPSNESRAAADQIRLLCERNRFDVSAALQKAVDAMFIQMSFGKSVSTG